MAVALLKLSMDDFPSLPIFAHIFPYVSPWETDEKTSHVMWFPLETTTSEASPEGDLRLQDILNHNVAGLGERR